MVQNYLSSSTIVTVLHTFQKIKRNSLEILPFSSIQTVHVFTIIYFVSHFNKILVKCVSYHRKKMITNIKGFVNRLQR